MSDSGEQKSRNIGEAGADMVSVAARDVSGCRILIPPSGGSNPPAPAIDVIEVFALPERTWPLA
jgi:hypothetical protein